MKTHLIWSIEHHAWWRANSQGYTRSLEDAGVYEAEEASKIVADATHDWRNVPNEVMVPIELLPPEALDILATS